MLAYQKCEVLITFMAGFVNRFTDKLRAPVLDELFATTDWRQIHSIEKPKRKKFLLDLYVKQLKEIGGAKYIRNFEMIGKNNQTIYYLIYGTKHWKGLEAMKYAMWNVDRRGIYRFSDLTDINQTYLIDYSSTTHWVPIVAEMVFKEFKGKTVQIDSIHKFVITETPYLFKKGEILRYLEKSEPPKIIQVRGRRRKLTFPNGCFITFSK